MLVPVPLCNFSVLAIVQTHQNIKLIIEIIEDNDPRSAFTNIQHFFLPACISVHQLPQQIAELAGGLDWLVLPEVPPVLADRKILHLVVIHKYILMVRYRRPLEAHVNQNPFPQPYQALGVKIPVDLRVLRAELAVYHMLVVEVRSVSIEPIGDEHRDIIRPAVPGGGAEQNPLVILRNFVERFHPCAFSNDSLLVKYKERILYANILSNIVPGIHHDLVLVNIMLWICRHIEMGQFFVPLSRIPFPGSRDDVKIRGLYHAYIILRVYLPIVKFVIKRQTRSRFSASYAST